MASAPTAPELARALLDARQATLSAVEDLSDAQWRVPRLEIVNPFLWEVGHIGWFQERWMLRHALGREPLVARGDSLWDSTMIPHKVRWDLQLPSREETLAICREVLERALQALEERAGDETLAYFAQLVLFHEDMHSEAFLYARQALGYPAPKGLPAPSAPAAAAVRGEAEIPGGSFELGARPGEGFVFDNEKWAHEVEVRPFAIARTPVTQGELAAFVEGGGYARRELWSDEGWAWREQARAELPAYWRRSRGGFERRVFDCWQPIDERAAMVHVNWHEARAFCRWARRRLPTELEWEVAAAGEPSSDGAGLGPCKRRFPWGDAPWRPELAHLDRLGPPSASAASHPAGASAFGCLQMLGNVWEWTESAFQPYPGFVADPYDQYSEPWFGTHKVLRGGAWSTRARLVRNTWRNFYLPHRRDPWAGFRTCAL